MSRLDLVRMVLDHQLVDADGHDCGRVDDIELDETGGKLRIRAIVAGPPAAARALWPVSRWLIRKLFGRTAAKVSWHEVDAVDSKVRLRVLAEVFRLLASEQKAARWISRLPLSE
jgi:sporulation protein YlmC with PRC-barrel domain